MSSEDEWKGGVPPLPQGVTPAPAPPAPWQEPVTDVLADARPAVGGVYDPAPVFTRTTEKNWQGILALVFGILGGLLLTLVFGLMSLRSYKEGKADNRGLAIAGLSVAGAWIVVGGLGVAAISLLGDDTIAVADAQVGDCFTSDLQATEDISQGFYTFSPCSEESNGIVYYVTAGSADVAYDDPGLGDHLYERCTTDAALAGVDLDAAYDYYIEYYILSGDEWDAGDRTVVCGLSTEGDLNYGVLTDAEPNMAS